MACFLIGVVIGSLATAAQAKEPWILDLEGSLGMAVNEPQRDWFGIGGSLAAGLQRPLAEWIAVTARLRTLGLLDGKAPEQEGVEDPGQGTLNSLSAGFLFRVPTSDVRRSSGLWLDALGGGGYTGRELRPAAEGGLGYGIVVGKRTTLSPMARYIRVFQPQGGLTGRDANLVLLGMRLSLFDAKPAAPTDGRTGGRPDRDHDGIPDAVDACVEDPEDLDQFEDTDGCPDTDNDQDSVPDALDGCPNMPEDADGFNDEDGCPDEDNDHDGILDSDDQCPLEPETLNGEQDEDGCPDAGLIVMEDDRIVLEERVLFETDRARVHKRAGPVLRAIIRLWKQHPEWKKVRIEGHADLRGDAEFNQDLSERRAANVREALIELGMDPSVVIAEGFGSTRPRRTGMTDADHQANRRVEFVVIAGHAPPLIPPESATDQGADATRGGGAGSAAEGGAAARTKHGAALDGSPAADPQGVREEAGP